MKFKDYLYRMSVPNREEFAKRVGCSRLHLHNVASEWTTCSAELAIAIDRESKGVIRAEELCPDVDWAYIRGNKQRSNVRTRADVQ